MHARATIIMMTNFLVNNILSIENRLAFFGFDKSPTAPSNVPAGQINLQKPGTCMSYLKP